MGTEWSLKWKIGQNGNQNRTESQKEEKMEWKGEQSVGKNGTETVEIN